MGGIQVYTLLFVYLLTSRPSNISIQWHTLDTVLYSWKFYIQLVIFHFHSFLRYIFNTRILRVNTHFALKLNYHFCVSQGRHFPRRFLEQILNSFSEEFYSSLCCWFLYFWRLPNETWNKYPSSSPCFSNRRFVFNYSTFRGFTTGCRQIPS
jgi:hypothetical protein